MRVILFLRLEYMTELDPLFLFVNQKIKLQRKLQTRQPGNQYWFCQGNRNIGKRCKLMALRSTQRRYLQTGMPNSYKSVQNNASLR